MKKKVILGNIYRPPKDINEMYRTFIDEFAKLVNLNKFKREVKYYYKLVNNNLLEYFSHIPYLRNFQIHQHYTRGIYNLFIPRVNHEYTKKYIRHNVIETVNNTPSIIIDDILSLIKFIHIVYIVITYIKN